MSDRTRARGIGRARQVAGGIGNDRLISSGNSKDLLVGGSGTDLLDAGAAEDVLVAGRTSYDAGSYDDVRALTAILNEWSRASSYATSIAHITGTLSGGLNGSSVFRTSGPSATVFDDADIDTLVGGTGRDWLLAGAIDQKPDLAGTEVVTGL